MILEKLLPYTQTLLSTLGILLLLAIIFPIIARHFAEKLNLVPKRKDHNIDEMIRRQEQIMRQSQGLSGQSTNTTNLSQQQKDLLQELQWGAGRTHNLVIQTLKVDHLEIDAQKLNSLLTLLVQAKIVPEKEEEYPSFFSLCCLISHPHRPIVLQSDFDQKHLTKPFLGKEFGFKGEGLEKDCRKGLQLWAQKKITTKMLITKLKEVNLKKKITSSYPAPQGKKDIAWALKVFQLPHDYSEKDLKRSYKALVKERHPDRRTALNIDKKYEKIMSANFQYIQQAHDILIDNLKKADL